MIPVSPKSSNAAYLRIRVTHPRLELETCVTWFDAQNVLAWATTGIAKPDARIHLSAFEKSFARLSRITIRVKCVQSEADK